MQLFVFGDTDFFDIVEKCSVRGYISLIPVHNLPRLCASNVDRLNKIKWLNTGKCNMQTIHCTNNYGCGLGWWQSGSGKYARSGRMSAEWYGGGSRRYEPPCQGRQNREHVLESNSKSKRRHLHSYRLFLETSVQIHLPQNQRIISAKWHQYATCDGMVNYR